MNWLHDRFSRTQLVIVAGLVACTADPGTAVSTWEISPAAYGPLRTGMTVAEMNTALGATFSPTAPIGKGCELLIVPGGPQDLRAMIVDSVLVRFDVTDTTTKTTDGARVGTNESALIQRFGPRAVISAHKYRGPPWHYVTVVDTADVTLATVFETNGERVVRYRAGRRPQVEWVEGCG